MIAIIFIIVFNLYRTSSLSDNTTSAVVGTIIKQQSTGYVDVTPKGIPRIYGEKLGVSYDDISISDQKKADKIIGDIGNLDNKVILTYKDNSMGLTFKEADQSFIKTLQDNKIDISKIFVIYHLIIIIVVVVVTI